MQTAIAFGLFASSALLSIAGLWHTGAGLWRAGTAPAARAMRKASHKARLRPAALPASAPTIARPSLPSLPYRDRRINFTRTHTADTYSAHLAHYIPHTRDLIASRTIGTIQKIDNGRWTATIADGRGANPTLDGQRATFRSRKAGADWLTAALPDPSGL